MNQSSKRLLLSGIVFIIGTTILSVFSHRDLSKISADLEEKKVIISSTQNCKFFTKYDDLIRPIDSISTDSTFVYSQNKVYKMYQIILVE